LETPASLRENAPYRLGKYAMNRASRPRPMAASVNISPMVARLRPFANPSVSRAEPDSVNANDSGRFPRAQYIAMYPMKTRTSHRVNTERSATGA
jgi:hypothetical protein